MNHFDAFLCPLHGFRVIEASAGTGKTYAITTLYLRLIVEGLPSGKALTPENILVLTFTRAATEELRSRIRSRLVEALNCLREGTCKDKPLETWLTSLPQREESRLALLSALASMEGASIFTIHGFCQRVLQRWALDTGVSLSSELQPGDAQTFEKLINDYWRRRFYGEDKSLTRAVYRFFPAAASLAQEVRSRLDREEVVYLPEEPREIGALDRELSSLAASLQAEWTSRLQEVPTLLEQYKVNRRSYNASNLARWLDVVSQWVQEGACYAEIPGDLEKFTPSFIREKTQSPPENFDRLFMLAGTLWQRSQLVRPLVIKDALQYIRHDWSQWKNQHGVLGYSDLLTRAEQALANDGSGRLSLSLRQAFPIALIDESQDTDFTQWNIFQKIYLTDTPSKENSLFLIGDPKQAIYSFRGADVFTYIKARERCPEEGRYTMTDNWRSTPQLVEAVNQLFSQVSFPFGLKGMIQYYPNKASRPLEEGEGGLRGEDDELAAMQFLVAPDGEGESSIEEDNDIDEQEGETALLSGVDQHVAQIIFAYLQRSRQGRLKLGNRPLEASDIAVLVRSHAEAQAVRRALSDYGIDTAYIGNESVFATLEAQDLLRVLRAVSFPTNGEFVRGALASSVMALTWQELALVLQNTEAYGEYTQCFVELNYIWTSQGFLPMFWKLLHGQGLGGEQIVFREHRARFINLGSQRNKRRLTNFLHLGELLQSASENFWGPESLLRWFEEMVLSPTQGVDDTLLRMESDEQSVKIVTIHRSKGLQYEVVFVPHPPHLQLKRANSFHEVKTGRLIEDLRVPRCRSEEENNLIYEEALAESLRLFYVAVTRAKKNCIVALPGVKRMAGSSLGYLLGAWEGERGQATLKEGISSVSELVDDFLAKYRLGQGADGKIFGLMSIPQGQRDELEQKTEGERVFREFPGWRDDGWRVTSYSGLIAGRRRDEIEKPEESQSTVRQDLVVAKSATKGLESGNAQHTIFNFPHGVVSGLFFHEVLEGIVGASTTPFAQETLIREGLRAYGLDDVWFDAAKAGIEGVMKTNLPGLNNFNLSLLESRQCKTELEFDLSFAGGGLADWEDIVAEHYPISPVLKDKVKREKKGLLRGYIDLVFQHDNRFYIVDYKTNTLGPSLDAYSGAQISEEMQLHHYHLQYLLYSLALDCYLKSSRIDYEYERHFGGIFYLFVRGIDVSQVGWGIYQDRPPYELILKMKKAIGIDK